MTCFGFLRDFVVQFTLDKKLGSMQTKKKPHGGGLQCGLAEEETRLIAKLTAVESIRETLLQRLRFLFCLLHPGL
jgi:hypothetical protein